MKDKQKKNQMNQSTDEDFAYGRVESVLRTSDAGLERTIMTSDEDSPVERHQRPLATKHSSGEGHRIYLPARRIVLVSFQWAVRYSASGSRWKRFNRTDPKGWKTPVMHEASRWQRLNQMSSPTQE